MVLAHLLVLLIRSLQLVLKLLDFTVELARILSLPQLTPQVLELLLVPAIVALESHRLVAWLLDAAVRAL